MDPARELGKWLILGGLILATIGVLFFIGGRLPLRLGRLPGDIAIEGKRGSFYFPVVTCILLSVVLTLVMWLVSFFRR
jgi:ABC-type tungstate transport system substrate-binding protein